MKSLERDVDFKNEDSISQAGEEAMSRAMAKHGTRKVVSFQRIRAVGVLPASSPEKGRGPQAGVHTIISVWRLNSEIVDLIRPGRMFTLTNVRVNKSRFGVLNLSTTPRTNWSLISDPPLQLIDKSLLSIAPVCVERLWSLSRRKMQEEVDLFGYMLFLSDQHECGDRRRQWLFLLDLRELSEQQSNRGHGAFEAGDLAFKERIHIAAVEYLGTDEHFFSRLQTAYSRYQKDGLGSPEPRSNRSNGHASPGFSR